FFGVQCQFAVHGSDASPASHDCGRPKLTQIQLQLPMPELRVVFQGSESRFRKVVSGPVSEYPFGPRNPASWRREFGGRGSKSGAASTVVDVRLIQALIDDGSKARGKPRGTREDSRSSAVPCGLKFQSVVFGEFMADAVV